MLLLYISRVGISWFIRKKNFTRFCAFFVFFVRYVTKMQDEKEYFRYILFFYHRKGKNSVQARKKLCKVYEKGVLMVSQCENWFWKFRFDNFDVEDAPCVLEDQFEADKDKMKASIEANRHITNNNNLRNCYWIWV